MKTGGRRYADTTTLISDFSSFPFDSERHCRAMARTNWIHGLYKIPNDDLLYTLSVFCTCPQRWLEKYDWRPLTDIEVEVSLSSMKFLIKALWILWREIGYQMGIQGLPRTYEEITEWADEYEKQNMVPNEKSHELAETTTALLLYNVPNFIKPFAKQLVIAMMDDRLRKSMIYPVQPRYIYVLIEWICTVRRFLIRNFHLPRIFRVKYTSDTKNKFGRYTLNYSDNEVAPVFFVLLIIAVVFAS